MMDVWPMRYSPMIFAAGLSVSLAACGWNDCDEYGSSRPCSYIIDDADYEVRYWRNIQDDNPADEIRIGRAKGLEMCRGNAAAFAATIGEPFNERAYICILVDADGVEKHRL